MTNLRQKDDDRSDRGAFEKWILSEPGSIQSIDLQRDFDDQYTHPAIADAWAIWQAARTRSGKP